MLPILRKALEGKDLPRRSLYFETLSGALNYGWAELKGVRRGPWKLIDSAEPELYNLEEDPGEMVNLAVQANCRDILDEHRKRLLDWCRETDDPFVSLSA